MNYSGFSFRNPWIIYFLIPVFTLACGNFTMFIISSLILGSSAFLLKHKVQVLEEEEQHHYQKDEFDLMNSDQNDSNQMSNVVTKECLNVGSPDSDFDYFGEKPRIPDCSDGSISDEENLIEIELPGGHYLGYRNCKDEEEAKFYGRRKSSDSVLWWPEMEEENMIEIDILMGSIKCSRYEMKA